MFYRYHHFIPTLRVAADTIRLCCFCIFTYHFEDSAEVYGFLDTVQDEYFCVFQTEAIRHLIKDDYLREAVDLVECHHEPSFHAFCTSRQRYCGLIAVDS